MKSNDFPDAPVPKPKVKKSKIEDGRCVHTGKKPLYKKKAEGLTKKWKPDDKGSWEAYKCPYGKSHWHVGHVPIYQQSKGDE